MIGSAKVLLSARLIAEGGDVGFVEDCLFDETTWRLGYFVVTLETTRDRRQVLVSTQWIRAIDWDAPAIEFTATRAQLERAPKIESKVPVSRHQDTPIKHYRWPFFFTGAGTFGVDGFPEPAALSPEDDIGFGHNLRSYAQSEMNIDDRHLRSIRDIDGYRIHASNEVFGHVTDFIFDVSSWKINSILVNPQHWWSAKPVEISAKEVKQISWEKSEVLVEVTKEHLIGAPYTESNSSL